MSSRKTFLLIVMHLIAVLCAVRVFSDSVNLVNRGFVWNVRGRFQDLLVHMDRIKSEPDTTRLFVGASSWHNFLNPVFFDAEMENRGQPGVSYNLSFLGLVGSPMLTWVSRLRDEFAGRQMQTTFIEFSPVALGTEFNLRRSAELDGLVSGIFVNSKVWRSLLVSDPQNAVLLKLHHAVQPVNWRVFPGIEEILPIGRRRTERDSDPEGMLALWKDRAFHERPLWNLATRGMSNFNRPRSEPVFQRTVRFLQTPEQSELSLLMYKRTFHPNPDFRFDSRAVQYFIDSVRSAETFSRRVYLVWLPNSPPFEKLVNENVPAHELVARLERETGAKIIDLRGAVPVTEADFIDPMHPTREATNRFLSVLADRVAVEEK